MPMDLTPNQYHIHDFTTLGSLLKHQIIFNNLENIIERPIKLYNNLHNNTKFINNFILYQYIDIELDKSYEIIVFSDIHADLPRFIDFLIKMNLIKIIEDKYIWNPLAINKALVICGDIIDGSRPNINSKNDNMNMTDNNELKLHILIYNLRLLASKHNSYIFCTLGNHDYFATHVNPEEAPNYIYKDYIDKNSSSSFVDLYLSLISKKVKEYNNNLKEKKLGKQINEKLKTTLPLLLEKYREVLDKIDPFDKVYMARNFLLARFYAIGHHFFLKINDSLFAHAGFYKESNVFELFENGNRNSDSIASPQLIHRHILHYLSDINNHLKYFCLCLLEGSIISYGGLYRYTTQKVLNNLYKNFHEFKIHSLFSHLHRTTEESLVNSFFQTRNLQKNCALVKETLNKYNCNILVVGHCPTCLLNLFNASNVKGISSCNNAKIVLSCENKLATVDIAFSSAFSPKKQFYEYLSIQYINGEKQVKVVNFNTSSNQLTEHSIKKFNGRKWM